MFQDWYRNRRQDVTGWFKDLHRHPEVGFEETRTSVFVAQRLRDMGLEPVTGIAGTGVVATLHGTKGQGRTIGLAFGPSPELQMLWGQLQRIEALHSRRTEAAASEQIHLTWGQLAAAGHRLKAWALVVQ